MSEVVAGYEANSSTGGRFSAVVKAALLALVIGAVSSGLWGVLLTVNLKTTPAIAWSVPAMAGVLWVGWRYLGGRWRPKGTESWRRTHLRARLVPLRMFAWSGLAGALSLTALAGLWIMLVEVTGVGGNPTLPKAVGYPITVALVIAMASLVSPITEEAAFRGYAQTLLERRFPAVAAVATSSALFALWHGPTQGFAWSKLLFFFLVGVVFGTIAYRTNSILPALPVHIAGDLLFFVVIWPHDAARPLIHQHGVDVQFWLLIAQVVVFGGLAVLAFARLRN